MPATINLCCNRCGRELEAKIDEDKDISVTPCVHCEDNAIKMAKVCNVCAAPLSFEDMGKREDRQATWIGRIEQRGMNQAHRIYNLETKAHTHESGTPHTASQAGGALPVDQASSTVRLVAERDEAWVRLKQADATISRFANERDNAEARAKQLEKERNDAFAVVDLERAKVADADCKVYRLTGERDDANANLKEAHIKVGLLVSERDNARRVAESMRNHANTIFPWEMLRHDAEPPNIGPKYI